MSFSLAVVDCAVAHPYYTLASASLLFFTGLATVRWSTSRCNLKRLPYLPGPKGYPIIKNLLDVPTDKPWLTYHEWGRIYGEPHAWPTRYHNITLTIGDMIFFEVLGQSFLGLNSLKRTNDLLETWSSNYSDRMRAIMLVEL